MKYNLSTKIPFSEFYSLDIPILAFRLSNSIVIIPRNVFISTFLDALGRGTHTHMHTYKYIDGLIDAW